MTDVAISVRGLHTSFSGRPLHSDLDLDVHRGEILGIVGGSGSGKSVLMRSIIGLNRYDAGEIRVLGARRDELSPEANRLLARRWGVLFQEGALFTQLSVRENVEAPLREHADIGSDLRRELADLKLLMAGLPGDAANKYPSELSGGMRKRAALARALALDPELLFLDEPTAGLDPIAAQRFDALIVELKEALGLTVFLITHDLDTLAAICDRVAVLLDGKVAAIGALHEVRAGAKGWMAEYFNGPRGRAAIG